MQSLVERRTAHEHAPEQPERAAARVGERTRDEVARVVGDARPARPGRSRTACASTGVALRQLTAQVARAARLDREARRGLRAQLVQLPVGLDHRAGGRVQREHEREPLLGRAEPDGGPGQAGGHEREAGEQRRALAATPSTPNAAPPPRPVPIGTRWERCSVRPALVARGGAGPRATGCAPAGWGARRPGKACRSATARGAVAVGRAREQLAVEVAEALDGRRSERAELRVHVRRARPPPGRPRRARTGSGACGRSARSRRCRARGRARRRRCPSSTRPSAGRCDPAAASGRASAGRRRRWWRSSCRPARSAAGSSSPRRAARGCRRARCVVPSTNSARGELHPRAGHPLRALRLQRDEQAVRLGLPLGRA